MNEIKSYIDWCERTGSEINSESYQDFLSQEAIEEFFEAGGN